MQAFIVGNPGDGILQYFKKPGLYRHAIKEHQVDDNPYDADQAEGTAEQCGGTGHGTRHIENEHGDDQRRDHPRDRSDMRRNMKEAQSAEQNEYRHGGEQRRDDRATRRVIVL